MIRRTRCRGTNLVIMVMGLCSPPKGPSSRDREVLHNVEQVGEEEEGGSERVDLHREDHVIEVADTAIESTVWSCKNAC